MATSSPAGPASRGHSFISWGAVFAGALVGIGIMVLLTALWLALAAGTGPAWVVANLTWIFRGTAIFAILLAGFLAGWFAVGRGPGSGLLHGLTVWGLITTAAVLLFPNFGVLGVLGGLPGIAGAGGNAAGVWTVFWSTLIGLGAALVGGLLGGPLPGLRQGPVSAGQQ